jgi:hypothetical protein
MKILTSILLLAIGLYLPFSSHSQNLSLRCPDKVKNSFRISESDGNGNVYIIKSGKIEYQPVQANQSSSGTYSGGVAKKAKLSQKAFDRIAIALNTAIDTPETHIFARMKGSVVIDIQEGGNSQQFIISPKSLQINEIEKSLQEAID